MVSKVSEPRVIVALDCARAEEALVLAARLGPGRCAFKVGQELFTRAGPDVVSRLREAGHRVFLDLKYHDIPNTVAGACRAAAELGVWMVDVHAAGGRAMLEAAREALESAPDPPLLVAVTVLTSLDRADLASVGVSDSPERAAERLARLAEACGLAGAVCAPAELGPLRRAVGAGFRLVTPGIRPRGAQAGDQKRVTTPGEAARRGADYVVIGRPITRAPDPVAALRSVEEQLAGGLCGAGE